MKQTFLEIIERLCVLKKKIKEDKELSMDFKKGFCYCINHLKEAKEFDSLNLALINKQLEKDIEQLQDKIRKKNLVIHKMSLKSNNFYCLRHISFIVNNIEIDLKTDMPDNLFSSIFDDLNNHILTGKNNISDKTRYTNKSIDFIRKLGFKAEKIN